MLEAFGANINLAPDKQAVFAGRDESHALDIVQGAMMKIAEDYGDRPAAELPLLFTRILQNVIHDFFRRSKVRSTWVTLFSALGSADEPDVDPLETLDASGDARSESTETTYEREQIVAIIEEEVAKLQARQWEAFLLRYWEDLDTAETAAAMGCSEGSVKTHCSRNR